MSDLDPDALSMYMASRWDRGLSAATINKNRNAGVAFANWARKTQRIESNPLEIVPHFDERKDRRRIRRPFSADELSRLSTVASERRRLTWYACAYYGGLRRGDLLKLRWTDIDFEHQCMLIEQAKAKGSDCVTMHDALVDILTQLRDRSMTVPESRVFPEGVSDRTRQRDFIRAGMARYETVTYENGEPVMVGTGKRRRPKTRFVCKDEEARLADLHCLRKTIGTDLAKSGAGTERPSRFSGTHPLRTPRPTTSVSGSAIRQTR